MLNFIVAASYSFTHVSVDNDYYQSAVVIAIGIMATYGGAVKLIKRAKLKSSGNWVEGEVIEIKEVVDENKSISYSPVITYTTMENEIITYEYHSGQSSPCMYFVGEKLPVVYSTGDKNDFTVNNTSSNQVGWIILVFGLSFLAFGLIPLIEYL